MSNDSELRARSKARLGTTLRGKYHLDRVLGMGGMAIVYAATHRNRKQFAVKVLHAELSHREDIRTRFLREGYAANSLKHRGAVAVLDDDVAEDGAAFIVMELLEGDALDRIWAARERRLPTRAVLAVGHQLLDVLAAAHREGVVHRDIKPPNLFLTEEGAIKVLDFGIARVRDAAAEGAQATGAGLLLGSPHFMAPEQALGESEGIDGQTDVWAAGATLFALLSGKPVHEGESATLVIVKAATTRPRSLSSVAPTTPPLVTQIIDRALAFDKASRWPSAEAMRDAIGDAYSELYGESVSPAPLLELVRDRGAPALSSPDSGALRPDPPPRAATLAATEQRGAPADTLPSGEAPFGGSVLGSMMTSNPVSSDKLERPKELPSRRRRFAPTLSLARMALGTAGLVVALGLALTFGRSSPGQPAPSPSTAPAASSPSASPESPPVVPAATPPIPSSSATEPASSGARAPSSPSSRSPVRSGARSPAPGATTTSAAPRTPKPAAPCAVVTTLDSKGNPHFSCPCEICE